MASKKDGDLTPQPKNGVKMDNYISKDLMRKVKGDTAKRNGIKQYASGISIAPPTYYNPLLTPTSLQLPRDRKQVYAWCRHFFQTEPIVAAVVNLYASLPIGDYHIECQNPYYRKFVEDMLKRMKIRELLQQISLEYWMIGDVFIMGELDEEKKDWKRFVVLQPDTIEVKRNMLLAESYYEMIPNDAIKRLVYDREPRDQYLQLKAYAPEVVQAVLSGKNVPLDAALMTHLRHDGSPYDTYGIPLMKRVFKTLMYKEMIRRAQFTIAERYVMPLKIFKLGTIDELPEQHQIDAMQEQLTMVLNDPSMILVTHARFQADWQGIAGKTLQLMGEYDFIERELVSGLGVSRALLDGGGPVVANAAIGGNAFLQKLENFRTTLAEFIEEKIFKPIAELNLWYDKDADTDEHYLVVPEFKWDALRLQDEVSRQQMLLQLRQMSLVSAKTLLDSIHINGETEAMNLMEERDTIFDSNRIMARQMAIQMGLQAQMQKQLMDMQMAMMPPAPGGGQPVEGQDPNAQVTGLDPYGGSDLLSGVQPGVGGGGLSGGSGFSPMQKATDRPAIAASLADKIASLESEFKKIIEEDDEPK